MIFAYNEKIEGDSMLKLVDIRKSYRTKGFVQNALNGVSLSFRENEFASILGASGSGKTTMLNIIGGLDQYDSGDLIIDGVSTTDYHESSWDTYRNNRVGFVFQSYNLIPHQTVLSNVELALTLSGVSKKERKARAIEALDAVGLIDHIHKLPTQMSGGQMQRVAIARALINNPEIVLADEPTGALDSQTSSQVMALLQEIAKDRLVIMVTHNPELAQEYTNRIIELKDGEVISDSNPYDAQTQLKKENKVKKTNMSFFTALALSVSNLMTKKTRTFITSLAGSIGIIGIAAILALASGINLYIEGIEQETMSAYPLSIDTSGIDITAYMMGGDGLLSKGEGEDSVSVINSISTMFSHQNKNDLKSLKKYMAENPDKIEPYVKSIQYKYGISPEIYLENEPFKTAQVNPDTIFSSFGMGPPEGVEMIMGGATEMGMQSFSNLPGDAKLFEAQYDVVKGHWPQASNEAIVVLMDNGMMSDFTMYSLGLKDRKELMDMFDKLAAGEEVSSLNTEHQDITYDDILGKKFKVINPAEKFSYDEQFEVWVDNSKDAQYMEKIIEEAMDLEIVGIVKANDATKTPMLSSGIYYTENLVTELIQKAASYDIVQAQINNPDINVFTNKTFDENGSASFSEAFQFSNFMKVDERKLQSAFKFDSSALQLDMSQMDINFDSIELLSFDFEMIAQQIANQLSVPVEQVSRIFESIMSQYFESFDPTDFDSVDAMMESFRNYLESPEIKAQIDEALSIISSDLNINEAINQVIMDSMSTAFESIAASIETQITQAMTKMMQDLPASFNNAVSIDSKAFMNAFEFNMDEEGFFNLMRSLSTQATSDSTSNLKMMGYRDLEDPTAINLYPKDFSTKENVIQFLNNYNDTMTQINQEEKVVKYSDLVGAMMSSVTTIIDTISYALIAFVAISLVVSSIMIGVITYVSVLERIKEIGILRAIGASKKDIRRVFNAETLIVGFVAGMMGISITYIMSLIASALVLKHFNIPNIAHLELNAALILIAISMFLAFIAGLIPSSSAAKKDPVEALRSE